MSNAYVIQGPATVGNVFGFYGTEVPECHGLAWLVTVGRLLACHACHCACHPSRFPPLFLVGKMPLNTYSLHTH